LPKDDLAKNLIIMLKIATISVLHKLTSLYLQKNYLILVKKLS